MLTPSSVSWLTSITNSVRRAYARADYWDERVRIMDWWAGRCREMEAGGIVIPLRAI
jgi:hypothetical protein